MRHTAIRDLPSVRPQRAARAQPAWPCFPWKPTRSPPGHCEARPNGSASRLEHQCNWCFLRSFVEGAGTASPHRTTRETGLRLDWSSFILGNGRIWSDIRVERRSLIGPIEVQRVPNPFGPRSIELPAVHTLRVATSFDELANTDVPAAQVGGIPVLEGAVLRSEQQVGRVPYLVLSLRGSPPS